MIATFNTVSIDLNNERCCMVKYKLDWKEKFSCKKVCKIQIIIFLTYKCVLQKTSFHSRLGVIYNPTSKINEENTAISRGILAAFLTQKNTFLRNFLRKLAKEETATAVYSGDKIITFLSEVSSCLK